MIRPVSGGCWGEACGARLRTQGAFQWHGYPDPVSVETCSCAQTYSQRGISGLCTKQIVNLQCGASARPGRNAVCRRSLPCVGMVDERPGRFRSRPEQPAAPCSLKPCLQKRLKKRTDCGGNHLGCSHETEKGLQCGLSGNRVVPMATRYCGAERGTASIGNERCTVGKTNPDLSRKIYLFCRR